MLGTILRNKWATLIVGLLLIGAGFYFYNKTDATCGGQTMSAGDTCTRTKYGISGTAKTADEQLKSQHLGGTVAMGVGGLMTVGSIVVIIVSSRRRKNDGDIASTSPVATA